MTFNCFDQFGVPSLKQTLSVCLKCCAKNRCRSVMMREWGGLYGLNNHPRARFSTTFNLLRIFISCLRDISRIGALIRKNSVI